MSGLSLAVIAEKTGINAETLRLVRIGRQSALKPKSHEKVIDLVWSRPSEILEALRILTA